MALNADAKKAVDKGMLNGSARNSRLPVLLNRDSKKALGKGLLNSNARTLPDRDLPTPDNLYPNPLLAGGSDIVADVYTTLPTSHGAGTFTANPCDAEYFGEGEPAYRFKSTGNSRFVLTVEVNRGANHLTLPRGKKYTFLAQARQFSSNPLNQFRVLGIAGLVGGAKVTQEDTTRVTDGSWRAGVITFELPNDGLSGITLRHGMGVSSAVTEGWYEAKKLTLLDSGDIVYDPPLPNEPDLRDFNPTGITLYDDSFARYRANSTANYDLFIDLVDDGSWDWDTGFTAKAIIRLLFGDAVHMLTITPMDGTTAAGTPAYITAIDTEQEAQLVWNSSPANPRIRLQGSNIGGSQPSHCWFRSWELISNKVFLEMEHNGEKLTHKGEQLVHPE